MMRCVCFFLHQSMTSDRATITVEWTLSVGTSITDTPFCTSKTDKLFLIRNNNLSFPTLFVPLSSFRVDGKKVTPCVTFSIVRVGRVGGRNVRVSRLSYFRKLLCPWHEVCHGRALLYLHRHLWFKFNHMQYYAISF